MPCFHRVERLGQGGLEQHSSVTLNRAGVSTTDSTLMVGRGLSRKYPYGERGLSQQYPYGGRGLGQTPIAAAAT